MKPKILTTLPGYTLSGFASDVIAGLTVAMVAIPLSIAIAIASGGTPAQGLTTAIIAGFLISLLGGSRVQIGGPTGAFIVVVYGVIAKHGHDGLLIATLMAGVLLLVAAFFRAGRLITLIPEPVISGFTVGIAVIIATSQLKDFLGIDADALPADFFPKIAALWNARGTVDLASVCLGVATVALAVVLRRKFPRLPGLIIAVAAASLLVPLFSLDTDTVHLRFGDLPAALPVPEFPAVSLQRMSELMPSAMIIAFLAAVESLLSAMVADRMIAGKHRPDAELLAQGTANLASALFGGLPATGAIARTATNVRAGGRTPVAGMVHAVAILAIMMAAAPLAGYMAMPAMAGLLMLTAWNMSEPHRFVENMGVRASDRFLFLMTMTLTVIADLTVAIALGVAVGLALRLQRRNIPPAEWTTPER